MVNKSLHLHRWFRGSWFAQEWAGAYNGATALLACGGPSLRDWPREAMEAPGVLLCSLNNAASHARPHLWFTGDRPASFCPQLTRDPGVVKLARMDGAASRLPGAGPQWGRLPGTWFYEPELREGMDGMFWESPKVPYMLNTLAAAAHMLWAMGVARVVLAGCDLGGSAEYFHGHPPTGGRSEANLRLYAQQRAFLRSLAPSARRAGLELVDCSPSRPLAPEWPSAGMLEGLSMCLEGYPAGPCDHSALPHGADAWDAARLDEGEWAL
jgi:hypothetical protein